MPNNSRDRRSSTATHSVGNQQNGFEEPHSAASRMHAGGSAGRDRDHRRARGPAPARGAGEAGVCSSGAVRQQPPPDRHRHADLSRRTASLPVRLSGRHRVSLTRTRYRHVRRPTWHRQGPGDRPVSGGGCRDGGLRSSGGRGGRVQSSSRGLSRHHSSLSNARNGLLTPKTIRGRTCGSPRIPSAVANKKPPPAMPRRCLSRSPKPRGRSGRRRDSEARSSRQS